MAEKYVYYGGQNYLLKVSKFEPQQGGISRMEFDMARIAHLARTAYNVDNMSPSAASHLDPNWFKGAFSTTTGARSLDDLFQAWVDDHGGE